MVGQGNQGLVLAADRFNPHFGYRFTTYAKWWILQSIFSFFDGQQMIKLPKNEKSLKRRVYGIIIEYLGSHSTEPTPEQIAEELNKTGKKRYSASDINLLLQMYDNFKVSSLNRPAGVDSDSEQIDFVVGDNGKDIAKSLDSTSIEHIVHNQIHQLETDDATKKILEEILFNRKQFAELTAEFVLRTKIVRQRYGCGLRLLRNALRSHAHIKEYFQKSI